MKIATAFICVLISTAPTQATNTNLSKYLNQAVGFIGGSIQYNKQCPKLISPFHKIDYSGMDDELKLILGKSKYNKILHSSLKFWNFKTSNDCGNFYQYSEIGKSNATDAILEYEKTHNVHSSDEDINEQE